MRNLRAFLALAMAASPAVGFAGPADGLNAAVHAYWQGSYAEAGSGLARATVDPLLSDADREMAKGYLAAAQLEVNQPERARLTLKDALAVDPSFHLERSLLLAKPRLQWLYERCQAEAAETRASALPMGGAGPTAIAERRPTRSHQAAALTAAISAGVGLVGGIQQTGCSSPVGRAWSPPSCSSSRESLRGRVWQSCPWVEVPVSRSAPVSLKG
jgi:hypothetical protein